MIETYQEKYELKNNMLSDKIFNYEYQTLKKTGLNFEI